MFRQDLLYGAPDSSDIFDDSVAAIFHYGQLLNLCFSDDVVIANPACHECRTLRGEFFNLHRDFSIQVPLVYTYERLNAKVFGQFHDTLQVMFAALSWFGYDQDHVRAGDGCNDRATDSGGAVDNDEVQIMLFSDGLGLLADQRNEFAGILLGDPQFGVY